MTLARIADIEHHTGPARRVDPSEPTGVTQQSHPASDLPSARANVWLNQFARNVFSQFGEDGIIEQILKLLPATNKWCVEFGAHDGATYSNSANLIANGDYRAVLIEPASKRFAKLVRRYEGNPRIVTLRQFVGFGPSDNLDAILAPLRVATDFDLLSIDIDGNDYHAWAAITKYRPKIVVIEFNPTIASGVEFVQEANPRTKQGNSITSIVALAKSKGYELIAVTWTNAIFVDAKYFPAFEIADNSVQTMRLDSSSVTHFFYGLDGAVLLRGQRSMVWHGVPLSQAMAQQVPFFLRGFPEEFGPIRMTLLRIYRRLRCIVQGVPWGNPKPEIRNPNEE